MWALVLDAEHLAALAPLRRTEGIKATFITGQLWLRGETTSDSLAASLRRIPATERYEVLKDQALLAAGSLVPRGFLPQGPWQPLEHWLPVTAPVAMAGECDGFEPTALRLVRDATLRQPNLLLTKLRAWTDYASSAAQFRLQFLSFAANQRGEALIRGVPLPPLPGRQLVETEDVIVEAGWTWYPAIEAAALRHKFDVSRGDLLLIQPGPAPEVIIEVIPSGAFVKATRSAARLTAAGGGA
jgi:hypothetical protein